VVRNVNSKHTSETSHQKMEISENVPSVPCFPATLAVARKLVAYLLAVDKSSQAFRLQLPAEEPTQETA
jgi:hypothetical protein